MAVIDIPVGTSAFTTYTFDADSGDVFNIPADMVGNITDNLSNYTLGHGSDVTLNNPVGADTLPFSGNQAFSDTLTGCLFRFVVTKSAASSNDQHFGGSIFQSALRADHITQSSVPPAAHG